MAEVVSRLLNPTGEPFLPFPFRVEARKEVGCWKDKQLYPKIKNQRGERVKEKEKKHIASNYTGGCIWIRVATRHFVSYVTAFREDRQKKR